MFITLQMLYNQFPGKAQRDKWINRHSVCVLPILNISTGDNLWISRAAWSVLIRNSTTRQEGCVCVCVFAERGDAFCKLSVVWSSLFYFVYMWERDLGGLLNQIFSWKFHLFRSLSHETAPKYWWKIKNKSHHLNIRRKDVLQLSDHNRKGYIPPCISPFQILVKLSINPTLPQLAAAVDSKKCCQEFLFPCHRPYITSG